MAQDKQAPMTITFLIIGLAWFGVSVGFTIMAVKLIRWGQRP